MGHRLNPFDEPVCMAVPKAMLIELGVDLSIVFANAGNDRFSGQIIRKTVIEENWLDKCTGFEDTL